MLRQIINIGMIAITVLLVVAWIIDARSAFLVIWCGLGVIITLAWCAVRSLPRIYGYWFALLQDMQSLKARNAQVAKLRREAEIVAVHGPGGVAVSDLSGRQWAFYGVPVKPAAGAEPERGEDLDADILPPLMPAIEEMDRLLIYGGSGGGKTELARHLAADRVRRGWQVWVIDPKPQRPGKWPKGTTVIGANRDYDQIENIGHYLNNELTERTNNFDRIEEYPRMMLIVDELNLLNLKIEGFVNLILPLLLEGREYGLGSCWIGQSKTAGSVGLKGRYDLLQCFEVLVGVRFDKTVGEGYAVVDFGYGDEEYIPPGRFTGRPSPTPHTPPNNGGYTGGVHRRGGRGGGCRPSNRRPSGGLGMGPQGKDDREQKILEAARKGLSKTAICKAVFGTKGGYQMRIIGDILTRYGLA